jgi:enoyl-CoA hydratase
MTELAAALQELDRDPNVRAIVLGGSERAFAAGADISELAQATPVSLFLASVSSAGMRSALSRRR